MRVAANVLAEDPRQPSGAYRFWTRVILEMAKRLEPGEELRLLVNPKSGHLYQGYGPDPSCIAHPYSNERRNVRTLSEHLYSPVQLPPRRADVLSTMIAPLEAVSLRRDKDLGLQRAAQFTWGATAAPTLDVYHEAADRREH